MPRTSDRGQAVPRREPLTAVFIVPSTAAPIHRLGVRRIILDVAPDLDLVAVVTIAWSGLGAGAPAIADSVLTVIVNGVLPAVR